MVKTEIYVSVRKISRVKIFPVSKEFFKGFRIPIKWLPICLWKVLNEAVKVAFNVWRSLYWANFSFRKDFLKFLVWFEEEKFLRFAEKNVVGKSFFQVLGKLFWWQSFSWLKFKSRNIYRNLTKHLSIFSQKLFSRFVKPPSTCPEDLFEDKVFWNFYCLIFFSGLEQDISGL